CRNREELYAVAASAVVPRLHLDRPHASGSELSAFGLHPPHRELPGCVGSLRQGNVLSAPAKLAEPLSEALCADVIDARADNQPDRPKARDAKLVEVLSAQV